MSSGEKASRVITVESAWKRPVVERRVWQAHEESRGPARRLPNGAMTECASKQSHSRRLHFCGYFALLVIAGRETTLHSFSSCLHTYSLSSLIDCICALEPNLRLRL